MKKRLIFKPIASYIAILFIYMLLPLFPGSAEAQTYYVSGIGNDANDGLTKETPWRTLAKVNTATPSDAVVLFRRGDVFRGGIDLVGTKTGVSFGAYGTGDNPVISGSAEITGWRKYGENIWTADILSFTDAPVREIHHLFVDGELMRIARYPNTGWLRVGETDPEDKTRFRDPDLAADDRPDGYWNGATLRIRTWNRLFEIATVKDYIASEGEILLESSLATADQPFLPRWGYYLDNILGELDSPGEWYFDPENRKIYLWPPDNADPNSLLVEGSTDDIGINVYWKDNTTIENLSIRHHTDMGILVSTCDNIVIQNNTFEYCGKGIVIQNAKEMLIAGNTFSNMLNIAIHYETGGTDTSPSDPGNSVIEKNTIRNTGMIPGYGRSGEENNTAIRLNSKGVGALVRQNTVENTGSHGIVANGGGHTIENNVIRGSMLVMNDGAGIYVSSNNNIIRGNFVLESFGNCDESAGYAVFEDGEGDYFRIMGMGIISGKGHERNLIEGNTIAHNRGYGLYLSQSRDTIIRDNLLCNNGNQVVFEGDSDQPELAYSNIFEGNTLYSLSSEQETLILMGTHDYGTFEDNYYCNPYSEIVIQRDSRGYSLAEWQKRFPSHDNHSKTIRVTFDEYQTAHHGPNLITNADFTSDIDEWSEEHYVISHDPDHPEMDEGAIKVAYEEDQPRLWPNIVEVSEGEYYLLKFSIIANGPGNVKVTLSDETSELPRLSSERYFAVDETRKDYLFVFQSRITSANIRPFFSSEADSPAVFWLDNVTFQHVEAILNDSREYSKLFSNMTQDAQTIHLEGLIYQDLDGNIIQENITLDPYRSQILILNAESNLPVITGFTPDSGRRGDEVTITGTRLTDATAVQFNGTKADYTVLSDEAIVATVPGEAVTGSITVITPEGTATSASDFTVKPEPAITGFAPASGLPGDEIIITGATLEDAVSVAFNGIKARFAVRSDAEIAVTVPERAVSGQISVILPEGAVSSVSDFITEPSPDNGDYYISSSEGDDTNDGKTPESPWKTLSRLNQALKEKAIRPGDRILFRRGDVFFGSICSSSVKGSPGTPVVYGAYGELSKQKPVISGYANIIAWKDSDMNGINVCEADVSHITENTAERGEDGGFDLDEMISGKYQVYPQYLFLNGSAQRLARHPNEGFFFIDEDSETESRTIQDSELADIPNISEWKGGEAVVRTNSRTYTNFEIESADPSSLTVAGSENVIAGDGAALNNGYFLQGKRAGLDAEGEWLFDEAAQVLFFVPPEGVSCGDSDHGATVSVFENGIQADDYITIENLQFEGYSKTAIEVAPGTEYSVIDNCVVHNSYRGVSGSDISHSILSNNTFRNIFDSGICFRGNIWELRITGNRLENIGLYPGIEGDYMGIRLEPDDPETDIHTIVSKNLMDTVGYAGIMLRSGGPSDENPTLVEKNRIRHALSVLAEGASIHLERSRGNIIRDNILTDAVGNKESWNAGAGDEEYTADVFGIALFGEDTERNQIIRNTVTHHDEGFHAADKTTDTILKDNLFYGNRFCQARFSMGDQAAERLGRHAENNVFYCTDPSQWVMLQESGEDHENYDFGTFDNNYYCNPFSGDRYAGEFAASDDYADKGGVLIWRRQGREPYHVFMNLYEYQQVSGQDANSETDVEKWTVFRIGDKLYEADEIFGENYISNSDFESGTGAWEVGGGEIFPDTRAELDGNCLRVTAGDGYNTRVNNGEHIPFDTDSFYMLSFSGLREIPFGIEVAPYHRFNAYSSKPMIGEKHSFPLGPDRHDYAYIFKVNATSGDDTEGNVVSYDMRIFFYTGKGDPDYWLDNVTLNKVSLKAAMPPEERSKLFVNDTDKEQVISLSGIYYKDLDGNLVAGESITLPPFSSKILTFWSLADKNSLMDVIRVLQALAGLAPDGIHFISDVNEDARIGLPEAIHLLQKLAGSES